MALTDEEILYNAALDKLGEYRVIEGANTEKQYLACSRNYTKARDEVQSIHKWNECKERAIIVNDNSPIHGYSYRYPVPSDFLRVNAIGDDEEYDRQLEGGYILTNYGRTPSEWVTDEDYVADQYVKHEGSIYLCASTHRSDDFDTDLASGYWTILGNEWTTGTAYTAGEYAHANSTTYRCLTAHTSGTFATDLTAGLWKKEDDDHVVIDLEYGKKLTTISLFSPLLYDVIATKLAIKISASIVNDPKLVKKDLMAEYEQLVLPLARSVNSTQGTPKERTKSKWLRSRY